MITLLDSLTFGLDSSAIGSTSFNSLTRDLATGNVILSLDTLYVCLVNGYVPSKTHSRRSDVTDIISGTDQPLSSVTATLSGTKTTLTANNPTWPSSSLSATGVVVYKFRGGSPSNDNLISYVDFGGPVTSLSDTFTIISFDTDGFLVINN